MFPENTTCTYEIDEPFARALKRVRGALLEVGLTIVGEWNLAARMRRALVVDLPPCLVLFAASAACTAEVLAQDPLAAVMTPLHIVVSARGRRTEVHVLRCLPRVDGHNGWTAWAGMSREQAEICRAIEKFGMRKLELAP